MKKGFALLSERTQGYVIIHFCVLLWGFTPIMGRLIELDAVSLVWWRMLFAAITLLLLPATWRGWHQLTPKLLLICLGSGCLLAITWMLFYLSVKLTNASVGALCLAATPLFISLFGPMVSQRRYQASDILLALIVLPSMVLVVGGIPDSMLFGLGVGLAAALVLAIFSGVNKLLANQVAPSSASCLVMASGALLVACVIGAFPASGGNFIFPGAYNTGLLLLLAVIMTALPMALLLVALRHISVFAQQTAVNLEPIYAILLAIPILGEAQQLSLSFYFGALLIVATVMLEPSLLYLKKRYRKTTEINSN